MEQQLHIKLEVGSIKESFYNINFHISKDWERIRFAVEDKFDSPSLFFWINSNSDDNFHSNRPT